MRFSGWCRAARRPVSIVILDDEPDRTTEIRRCLAAQFPAQELIVFDNAPDRIGWLTQNLEKSQLICLDHDLGPNRTGNDPGTGRDVANYLATRQPYCPVIIHTTNGFASELEIQISSGQMIFPTSPPGGVTDVKLGKYDKLRSNETTKVSRAPAPIFLIFVVSRGRCLEGLGTVRQSHLSGRL